jgi:hypothetical protein
MNTHTDRLRAFEKQMTRDSVAAFARRGSDFADTDIMSAYCRVEKQGSWFLNALSFISVLTLILGAHFGLGVDLGL